MDVNGNFKSAFVSRSGPGLLSATQREGRRVLLCCFISFTRGENTGGAVQCRLSNIARLVSSVTFIMQPEERHHAANEAVWVSATAKQPLFLSSSWLQCTLSNTFAGEALVVGVAGVQLLNTDDQHQHHCPVLVFFLTLLYYSSKVCAVLLLLGLHPSLILFMLVYWGRGSSLKLRGLDKINKSVCRRSAQQKVIRKCNFENDTAPLGSEVEIFRLQGARKCRG